MALVAGVDDLFADLLLQPQVVQELARQVVAAGLQNSPPSPQKLGRRSAAGAFAPGDTVPAASATKSFSSSTRGLDKTIHPNDLVQPLGEPSPDSTLAARPASTAAASPTSEALRSGGRVAPRTYGVKEASTGDQQTSSMFKAKTREVVAPSPRVVELSARGDRTDGQTTAVLVRDGLQQDTYRANKKKIEVEMRITGKEQRQGKIPAATRTPEKLPLPTAGYEAPILKELWAASREAVDPGSLQSMFPAARSPMPQAAEEEEDEKIPLTALEEWRLEKNLQPHKTEEEVRMEALKKLHHMKISSDQDLKLLAKFGSVLRANFESVGAAFKYIDRSNGGSISRTEFVEAVKSCKIFKKEAFSIFSLMDKAAGLDGEVRKQEFTLVWEIGQGSQETEEDLVSRFALDIRSRFENVNQAFAFLDTDGGGSLNQAEFKIGVLRFGTYTDRHAKVIFKFMDKDGGGKGTITRDEYKVIWDLGAPKSKGIEDDLVEQEADAEEQAPAQDELAVVEEERQELFLDETVDFDLSMSRSNLSAQQREVTFPAVDLGKARHVFDTTFESLVSEELTPRTAENAKGQIWKAMQDVLSEASPQSGLESEPSSPARGHGALSEAQGKRSTTTRETRPSTEETFGRIWNSTEYHVQKKIDRQRKASKEFEAMIENQGRPSITPMALHSPSSSLHKNATKLHAHQQARLERQRQENEENETNYNFKPALTKMARRFSRPDPMGRLKVWERQEQSKQMKLEEQRRIRAEELMYMEEVTNPRLSPRSRRLVAESRRSGGDVYSRLYQSPTHCVWSPGQVQHRRVSDPSKLIEVKMGATVSYSTHWPSLPSHKEEDRETLIGEAFDRCDMENTGFLRIEDIKHMALRPPSWLSPEQKEECKNDLEILLMLDEKDEIERQEFINHCVENFPPEAERFEFAVQNLRNASWYLKRRKVEKENRRLEAMQDEATREEEGKEKKAPLWAAKGPPTPRSGRRQKPMGMEILAKETENADEDLMAISEEDDKLFETSPYPSAYPSAEKPKGGGVASMFGRTTLDTDAARRNSAKHEKNEKLDRTPQLQIANKRAEVHVSSTPPPPKEEEKPASPVVKQRMDYISDPLPFYNVSRMLEISEHPDQRAAKEALRKQAEAEEERNKDAKKKAPFGRSKFKNQITANDRDPMAKLGIRNLDRVPRTVVMDVGDFKDVVECAERADDLSL